MSVVKSLIATSLAFGLVSLIGCSSEDPDPTPPVLSNFSHTDNQKILGSRAVVVSADASDESDQLTVTITQNGVSRDVTNNAGNFSASITLEDNDNTIVISARDTDNTTTETFTLNYPFFSFTDGQAASFVIGQPNLLSTAYNQDGGTAAAANTIANGSALVVVNDTLLIVDDGNHRVLGFNSLPTTDTENKNADFVIGQGGTSGNSSGIGATQLTNPKAIASDNTNLFVLHGPFVAPSTVSRAHYWSMLPAGNSMAEHVIGQSGFVDGSDACTSSTLKDANSIFVIGSKLLISDSGHNRVLIWNTIPATSGVPADLVLGQQPVINGMGQEEFTNCAENDSDNDGVSNDAPTASTMKRPHGIWTDGTKLAISDLANSRVLIWDTFPTSSFQPADRVLGQADFVSSISAFFTLTAPTASSLGPGAITSNGNQLFISDASSGRVMIWDSWPTKDNQPADQVLGANDLEGDVTGLTNASTFIIADGLAIKDDKLLLLGSAESRVLIFEAP